MRTKTQVLASILWLLIGGCTNGNIQMEHEINELNNSTWRLVAIESIDTTIDVQPADTILLSFQENRLIEGKSSGFCGNDYYFSAVTATCITCAP